MSQFNLDEEARLHPPSASKDRDRYDDLSTLFGLIISLDYLEKAYVKDSITSQQYAPACTRLLAQFKTIYKLVERDIGSVEGFMQEYRMDCTAASHRLLVGVPATVEHQEDSGAGGGGGGAGGGGNGGGGGGGNGGAEMGMWVAETTQNFITLMDALKLKLRAKDQLHPLLTELMSGYTRFRASGEWEGRPRLVNWLITLNQMRASEEITEEQSRQMMFDAENAYSEFFRSLSSNR
ncbi:vacuolar protein sorting-associated protein 28 [Meredithblackwellia eburnea MCA 4105]